MSTLYPPPIPTYPVSPMATCQLDGGEPLSVAAAVADHTAAFADLETLAADTRAQLEAWERGTRWMVKLDDFIITLMKILMIMRILMSIFYEDFNHHFHENCNDNLNENLMRSLMRIYDGEFPSLNWEDHDKASG